VICLAVPAGKMFELPLNKFADFVWLVPIPDVVGAFHVRTRVMAYYYFGQRRRHLASCAPMADKKEKEFCAAVICAQK